MAADGSRQGRHHRRHDPAVGRPRGPRRPDRGPVARAARGGQGVNGHRCAPARSAGATTSTRTPARGRSMRALPTVVFVHGAGERAQRLGAAIALFRAPRLRTCSPSTCPATARPAAPRCRRSRRWRTGSPRFARCRGDRRARRSSAIRWARSRRSNAAARHPERVAKLALLGPAAPMPVTEVLLDAAQRERSRRLRAHHGLVVQRGQAARRQPGAGHVDDRQRAAPDGAHAAGRAPHRSRRVRSRTRGGLASAARVRCPALVDRRRARHHGAAEERAGARSPRCPTCSVVTLPECGHAMMAEQPDAVLDALRAFL